MAAEEPTNPRLSVKSRNMLASLFFDCQRLLRHHLLTVDAVVVGC